jgi:hypothetical protein
VTAGATLISQVHQVEITIALALVWLGSAAQTDHGLCPWAAHRMRDVAAA